MDINFRRHFDLPRSVCYLDAASITPRALGVAASGEDVLRRSMRPWAYRHVDKASLVQRLRELAGALIGATPLGMSIVPAVSYAIATAAANLPLRAGARVLTIEHDHPSAVLAWEAAAQAAGATVEVVAHPVDGNWTRAILERIEDPQAPALDVAALPPLHWADGTLIDLQKLAPAVRRRGAALVVDATQAAGVLPIDVRVLQPDFLAFPAYKWLMGPYGCAFLYAAPQHRAGRSLEHHMGNRVAPLLTRADAARDYSYLPGAQRFDRGERDEAVMLTLAIGGLELLQTFSAEARLDYVRSLTDRLTRSVAGLELDVAERGHRAPHILGLGLRGREAHPLVLELEASNVFVSARLSKVRVAPYLYNDEADVDAFVRVLAARLKL